MLPVYLVYFVINKNQSFLRKGVFWIVGTQCTPDMDEDDYNRWYNESHIPLLMESGLVKSVQRMKMSDKVYHEANTTHVAPKYLAIYEFENGADLETWLNTRTAGAQDKLKKWGKNGGYEVFWTPRYDLIGKWERDEIDQKSKKD